MKICTVRGFRILLLVIMELFLNIWKFSCSFQYPTSIEINPNSCKKQWGHLLTHPGGYFPVRFIESCFYIVLLPDESWKSPMTLKQLVLENRKEAASLIIQSDIRDVWSAFGSSEIVTCIIFEQWPYTSNSKNSISHNNIYIYCLWRRAQLRLANVNLTKYLSVDFVCWRM